MEIHDRASQAADGVSAAAMAGSVLGLVEPRPVARTGVAARPADLPRPPVPVSPPLAVPTEGESRFLQLLRLEKRRSERSRAPLSLVMVRIAGAAGLAEVDLLFDGLCAVKRETDVLHCIPPTAVAVLCPYTDERGADAFVRKLERATGTLTLVASTATYPDPRFETLVDEIRERTHHRPFTPFDPAECGGGYPLKRLFDIVGSLVALALAAPLMLLIAASIKLTSPGPVIFRQTRLGRGGVPFTFYKFRSMRTGAPDNIHRDFVASLIRSGDRPVPAAADGSKHAKLRGDPRVTRLGRFIRKTSIDELPQFINVLRGEMSIVGPRPPIPYEAELYEHWHLRRILTAKPGITGLWQVEGRSRVAFDEMVRMDLRYARSCSLAFDVWILIRTVGVVLVGTGAG